MTLLRMTGAGAADGLNPNSPRTRARVIPHALACLSEAGTLDLTLRRARSRDAFFPS